MTRADSGTTGRLGVPDSERTIMRRQPAPPVSGEKARRRGFWSRNNGERREKEADLEGKPKKRLWCKGKKFMHKPFTVGSQLRATIFNSWINILLLAAPVGIALNYAGVNGTAVFVVNFIAIIPLAAMLSFATEEISLHLGESLGGLLNASFGFVHRLSNPRQY